MCKILCIFRNLYGVKFADFKFISLFTQFASFATFIKLHVSRPNLSGVNSIFTLAILNLLSFYALKFDANDLFSTARNFAFLYFYAAIFTSLLELNLIKILSLFV